MFFDTPFDRDAFVQRLLEPVFLLDRSLFKGEDDGLACKKKFSNNNNGIPVAIITKLDEIAAAISGGWRPTDWLSVVDVLTLYSNHLDQQLSDAVNPKLTQTEKEAKVSAYNKAAYALSPPYDYDHLERYTPRELSTHAQLLNHLGKALRYDGVSAEERLTMLENAVKIAKYLTALGCTEAEDPHAYRDRVPTFEMPVIYSLMDLKRFDEAAHLTVPQLSLESPFSRARAHAQLANIYTQKFNLHKDPDSLREALSHAVAAVEVSKELSEAPLIGYNARRSLMDTYQVAGEHDKASDLAREILGEIEANPNCGAKPYHKAAAEKILEENHVALSLSA